MLRVEGSRQLVPGPGWKTTENRFVNLPTEKTSEVLKQVQRAELFIFAPYLLVPLNSSRCVDKNESRVLSVIE